MNTKQKIEDSITEEFIKNSVEYVEKCFNVKDLVELTEDFTNAPIIRGEMDDETEKWFLEKRLKFVQLMDKVDFSVMDEKQSKLFERGCKSYAYYSNKLAEKISKEVSNFNKEGFFYI